MADDTTGTDANSDQPEVSRDEKRRMFLERFTAIMKDMGENVHKDAETLYLIGSLAAHLVDRARLANWVQLKAALSQEAYTSLLKTFQAEANSHHKKGNAKSAYAIEVLAISVICTTQRDDETIASGEELLDKMIEDTIGFFRRRSGKTDTAPKPN